MIKEDRIKFLSNGTWGVRRNSEGKYEMFFHSDPSEAILTCDEKYIHMIAMIMNGLITLHRRPFVW